MSLLIIGPRLHNNGQTGGVVVLMENTLASLQSRGVTIDVIDSNKRNYYFRWLGYISILFACTRKIPKADKVMLHGTAFDYLFIAPFVVFIGRLLKKKVGLAKFAGNYDLVYQRYSWLTKKVADWTLRHASILFWETQYLVEFFKPLNSCSYWLPNMRKTNTKPLAERKFRKRFVFLGHVNREKGVLDIKKVADELGSDYSFDLYGRAYSDDLVSRLKGNNISYRGELAPERVVEVIDDYDVLLLPSRREGEGYPGVVIEAFSRGMPTIAYELRGLKEMIPDNSNGLLVPVGDVAALKAAIENLDLIRYQSLSKKAYESLSLYEESNVIDFYLQVLNES